MAEKNKNKLLLGYWNIRGLGQLSRYLLEYTGMNYEEKRYNRVDEWFGKDKLNISMDFPNLPYLIDGDLKLTESHAINLYIIRKSGKNELLGTNLLEETKVRELIGVLEDIFRQIISLCFNPQFETIKEQKFNEDLKGRLERMDSFLAKDGKIWLLGKNLSLPDFLLYEIGQYIKGIYPGLIDKFPSICKLLERFEDIEEISNYMMSEEFIYAPFLSPGNGAMWTGLPK